MPRRTRDSAAEVAVPMPRNAQVAGVTGSCRATNARNAQIHVQLGGTVVQRHLEVERRDRKQRQNVARFLFAAFLEMCDSTL